MGKRENEIEGRERPKREKIPSGRKNKPLAGKMGKKKEEEREESPRPRIGNKPTWLSLSRGMKKERGSNKKKKGKRKKRVKKKRTKFP